MILIFSDTAEAPLPEEPPTKRETRLSTGAAGPSSGQRKYVLPAVCVICHQEGKFVRDKFSGVPKQEKLHSCETLEGGKLLKYTKLLRRHDILRLISGKDLVAIEAKYHKRCYQQLSREGAKREKYEKEEIASAEDVQYKKSFDLFCQAYIVKRIINDNEVLTLSKLRTSFVRLVKKTEGLDVPNYRSHNLKKRLFHQSPTRLSDYTVTGQ